MKRMTINDFENDQFIKMPKFLFLDKKFKDTSVLAKVAYSLLKDRMEISRKNNWVNTSGELYLLYTREDICKVLNVCMHTAIKTMKELKSIGLIEEKRRGLNKPNEIYIIFNNGKYKSKKFQTNEEYKAYINSKAWQAKREEAFNHYGKVCNRCKTTKGSLHVHHKSYKNFTNELMSDLEILCENCHSKEHA